MILSEIPTPPPKMDSGFHTSALLQGLINKAPQDFFTLDWLTSSMPNRSFGIIILFLGLLTLVPIVSVLARIILLILAVQIMAGYTSPVLPRRYMLRRLSTKYLTHLQSHAIPMLRHLEKCVRPRWENVLLITRRAGGLMAFILIVISLASPLPLANMPVAFIIILMALAYIEHDGLLLLIAHVAGLAFLGVLTVTIIEALKL